ncbi:MAG: PIG-L family deacetylase [Desulfotomaculum sp.]|nr:PIG-L family deacetylase [Desulfotomaculum sp.]
MKKIDILAVGAHPDDVELGVGGILASAIRMGSRVGVVDLTRGELASRGEVEIRSKEAQKAAEILGVTWRKNLKLPDRGIEICPENIILLTKLIRCSRPLIVLAPYYLDIHPDHVQTSKLVRQAWFDSGLKKYVSG